MLVLEADCLIYIEITVTFKLGEFWMPLMGHGVSAR